jgi:hypothetical protein
VPKRASKENIIRIFYHNCSGIRTKIKNLYIDAKSCNFNVLILTESWLNSSFKDEEVLDDNWSIFRNDRDYSSIGLTRGGGVLIAIKNEFRSEFVCASTSPFYESCFIKIITSKNTIYIAVVYFPPDTIAACYKDFLDTCSSIISQMNEDDTIFVTGDFNRNLLSFITDELDNKLLPINFLNQETDNVNVEKDEIDLDIINTFYGNDIQQINPFPNKHGKWLDMAFTNMYDDVVVNTINDDDPEHLFSNSHHHNAVSFELNCFNHQFSKSYNNQLVYDFHNANYDGINDALSNIQWDDLLNQHDLNLVLSNFYDILSSIIDNFTPKIVKKDKLSEPWLNRELRSLRNQRNKLYKIIKSADAPSNEILNEHKKLAEEFRSKSLTAYDEYVQEIGNTILYNPKKFFDFVNTKRKSHGYPKSMSSNGTTSSSSVEICSFFADKFQKVYRHSQNNVSNSNSSYPSNDNILIQSLNISIDDVFLAISNLDIKKGSGPDLLPPVFLYKCINNLCGPLAHIFNRSLSTGIFPDFWKTSYLIPIHKKGDKSSVDNYRGVAIESIIPKLFENIVTDKITPILDDSLSQAQHGFRKGRSTTTNLMVFTSDILPLMEKGLQVDAIYTDFSKAFDRIDHDILIDKLFKFGIRGPLLNWIKSYISERKQFVKFQGTLSSPISVHSGVPQGSHLGPLLFNIYINDLSFCLSGVSHLTYADDLKMYHVIKNYSDYFFFQSKLNNFVEWCTENRLDLNASKCYVISFTRKKSPLMYNYYLNSHILERVTYINDLGVILDCLLNFIYQYEALISRANKMLGFIKRRAKEFNNVWVTKTLYCSLVRSILEYGSIIWDPVFDIHRTRLESIQKQFLLFALRHLYNPREYYNLPPYIQRLQSLNLLSLSSRRTLLSNAFTFDVLNNNIDIDAIKDKIRINDNVRSTRHRKYLVETTYRTDYAKNNPANRLCILFNQYQDFYSSTISKNTYKSKLCTELAKKV